MSNYKTTSAIVIVIIVNLCAISAATDNVKQKPGQLMPKIGYLKKEHLESKVHIPENEFAPINDGQLYLPKKVIAPQEGTKEAKQIATSEIERGNNNGLSADAEVGHRHPSDNGFINLVQ